MYVKQGAWCFRKHKQKMPTCNGNTMGFHEHLKPNHGLLDTNPQTHAYFPYYRLIVDIPHRAMSASVYIISAYVKSMILSTYG